MKPITGIVLTLILFSTSAIAASPQWVPLTYPLKFPENNTANLIYDVAMNSAPPFAVYQEDQGLKDLFDDKSASQLCFPAALTTALVKEFCYQSSPIRTLKLQGVSGDRTKIDVNAEIRELFQLCHTKTNKGTDPIPAVEWDSSPDD